MFTSGTRPGATPGTVPSYPVNLYSFPVTSRIFAAPSSPRAVTPAAAATNGNLNASFVISPRTVLIKFPSGVKNATAVPSKAGQKSLTN